MREDGIVATNENAEQTERSRFKRFWKGNGGWWTRVFIGLFAFYIMFGQILAFGMCDGSSMEGTLHNGDLLLFQRIGFEPSRGDIVMFRSSGGRHDLLVKRVIGVPGDVIEIDDQAGTVTINGEVLVEPYLGSETHTDGDLNGPVVVEEGHYFVMGDNRMNSLDSRSKAVGQVAREDIKGKLLGGKG